MSQVIGLYKKYKIQAWFTVMMGLWAIISWYATTRKYEFIFGIPMALVVFGVAVSNFRVLWQATILMVPLSINLAEFVEAAALRFPTDLFCIMLILVVAFKMISEPTGFQPVLRHPLVTFMFFYFAWMYITVIASWDPVVSVKRALSMTWMAGAFFIVSAMLFRDRKYYGRYFIYLGISFAISFLTIFLLYISIGRNPFALRFNPMPFFDDHTALGAFTSMLVPLFMVFSFSSEFPRGFRKIARVLMLFIIAGLFFSFSRGAWAGAALGILSMGLVIYRRLLKFLILPAMLASIPLMWIMFVNPQSEESRNISVSRKGGYADHVKSITNWKTDYSNAERLNRWACAWRMFSERPVFGFGPGTYMFTYGDFQHSKEITPVSTNRGDNGTAHNEILLAFSEMGMIGGLLTILLFVLVLWYGIRGYFRSEDKLIGMIYIGCTFSLFTYIVHSFVNNFMDQDKIAVVFFGMMAMIVSADVYHAGKKETVQN